MFPIPPLLACAAALIAQSGGLGADDVPQMPEHVAGGTAGADRKRISTLGEVGFGEFYAGETTGVLAETKLAGIPAHTESRGAAFRVAHLAMTFSLPDGLGLLGAKGDRTQPGPRPSDAAAFDESMPSDHAV